MGGGIDASTFLEMEKRGGVVFRSFGEEEFFVFYDCKVLGGMFALERFLDFAGVFLFRKKLRLFFE